MDLRLFDENVAIYFAFLMHTLIKNFRYFSRESITFLIEFEKTVETV